MRLPSKLVLADGLLALVLTGLTLATLFGQTSGVRWWAVALAVLSVAPIAVRQVYPVITMAVILGAVAASSLATPGELPSFGIGIVVGMFTLGTLRARTTDALMFAASVAVVALVYARVPGSVIWSQVAQSVLTVAGAWVLGNSTKLWALRAQRAAARAERAVADERARIARELHDVVAHHISVVSLQAGVAEYVLDADRDAARTAIGVVSRSGREALTEMRRLLDVLRADGDDPALRPQPGVADIDDLVRRVGAAGLPVEFSVSGDVLELPAGASLCVFRVVQESLTNVLRHAGPARASVALSYGEHGIVVTIADDGRGGRAPHRSNGSYGISGMRERAELYGGRLSAGPRRGGGFEVSLRLPIGAAS